MAKTAIAGAATVRRPRHTTPPLPSRRQEQQLEQPSRDPLLSVSLTAVAAAAVLGIELAITHGHHRAVSVALILEAYAVLVGAPVFLAPMLSEISGTTAQAAKERRYKLSRLLRWPWRRGSLLRRIASALIITPMAWQVVAQLSHMTVWQPPAIILALAIVTGMAIGLLGWIAVLVPEPWSTPQPQDVVTPRALIKHKNAPAIGGLLAALLLLASVGLRLLDLYGV
jgi:hypothetical protein